MPINPRSLAHDASVSVRPSGTPSPCISAPHVDSAMRLAHLPDGFRAGAVLVLVAAGTFSLFPLWQTMGRLWAADPLRSIGAAFPLVACAGVLAAWRRLGWRMDGSFWALLLVGLSIIVARVVGAYRLSLVAAYDGQSLVNFGTALFLYGIGAVLLFGGPRLLRASIAPLCLLLLINPVPHAFNSLVDIPLQNLSALTARSFAHHIGLQPTGVQLRLMFAPDFGMFIAPGCNGVRGSITLGYLALIFGYARQLRPRPLILVSLVAVVLGYALNLLRLCALVVYYRIGVSFPSIQKHGAGVDYVIGCTLFLFAAAGLGLLIRSLEPVCAQGIQNPGSGPAAEESCGFRPAPPVHYAVAVRSICFLVLCAAFIAPKIRSATSLSLVRVDEQSVLSSFPARVGAYRLTRTWAEHNGNGIIALAMAEYSAPPNTGDTVNNITLGLWVTAPNHLVADSKSAQGILAQSTGSFDAITQQALPAHFVTSFYDDGITRQYDAESACLDTGCSSRFAGSRHDGLFFAAPGFSHLAFTPGSKRLPILLRREWLDSDPTPSADLRLQFEADARLFMAQLDLQSLLTRNGSQL